MVLHPGLHPDGLSNSEMPKSTWEKLEAGEITEDDVRRFVAFLKRVKNELYSHPVIVNNPYTKWFKLGEANTAQVIDLYEQFSVFSNHFLPIQTKRTVNANTDEGELEGWNILMNEFGAGFGEDGNVEGQKVIRENAHIEWLRKNGGMLGIPRRKMGDWNTGTPSTHRFLEGLEEVYGSRDGNIGAGASFAIESWAGFGIGKGKELEVNNFWKELINGLVRYNEVYREGMEPLEIEFFEFHFQIESRHVDSVERELEETFFNPIFDEEKWMYGAKHALDDIYKFWHGLDETRKTLVA